MNIPSYEVACEGEVIDTFSTALAALTFARWSAEITGCEHAIFDVKTRTALLIVDCPEAA